MKPEKPRAARRIVLARYGAIAAGTAWWLVLAVAHVQSSTVPGFVPASLLLVAGIVFNVVLDLLERFRSDSRATRALLSHQMLFDLLAANLFLGAVGSAALLGEPVWYGGTRILPFDASLVATSGLLLIAMLVLEAGYPVLYIAAAFLGSLACHTLWLVRQMGSAPLDTLTAAVRGATLAQLLTIAIIGGLAWVMLAHSARERTKRERAIAELQKGKEQAQDSFHKLSFLTAIIRDMAAPEAYTQVLDSITDRAALFFSADDALIATIDTDGEHLSVVAARSEYREQLASLRIRRGEGIMGQVYEGDNPELVRNALLDPRAVHVYGTPEEAESMMVAPLRKGGQKYGLVSVSRVGTAHPFDDEDLALFTSFADIAASVLDNASIMEDLRRKNFTLSVTNELSAAIVSPRPLEEEVSRFLSIMKESFQLSRISFLLSENDRFTRFFTVPSPASALPPADIVERINHGAGLVNRALHQRTIVNVPDTAADPDYVMSDPDTHSEFVIPLKNSEGDVMAVLNMESSQLGYFTGPVSADILSIATEVQEFLQGRLIWEEVKDQRNVREAINRAERDNIDVSTPEEAVLHLRALFGRILPAFGVVLVLENAGNTTRPWIASRTTGPEEEQLARAIERGVRTHLEATQSLQHALNGLTQEHTLIVRQLMVDQRLVGFVVTGLAGHAPLTARDTGALELFMAYAESLVQKVLVKQRGTMLMKYRMAAKELLDTSFKRSDLRQFLVGTARKLQDTMQADLAAYVPYDPEAAQFALDKADAVGFTPDPAVQPGILTELAAGSDVIQLRTDGARTTPLLASAARTELALRVNIEGNLYGALYIGFTRPVLLLEDELRMIETFVTDCSLVAENMLYLRRIDELSVTDELTGLGNYRAFVTHSIEQSERTARFGEVFSLLFFDIDDFKNYNDTFSHLDGNLALQGIADILRHGIRTVDSVYRYGGEEFVILMPGASSADARKAAERIRAAVERSSSRDHHHFRRTVTISGGVASFNDRVADPKNLLLLADLAMYQAKKSGKNAVYVLDNLSRRGTTTGATE